MTTSTTAIKKNLTLNEKKKRKKKKDWNVLFQKRWNEFQINDSQYRVVLGLVFYKGFL